MDKRIKPTLIKQQVIKTEIEMIYCKIEKGNKICGQ